MARRRRKRQSSFDVGRSFSLSIPSNFKVMLVFIVGFMAGYMFLYVQETPTEVSLGNSSVRACFTPGQNCESQIIALINRAKKEILVQSYSFTSSSIASALIEAHKRGVYVAVLCDRRAATERYSQVPILKTSGIKTIPDKAKGIAHNKVILVDSKYTVTGSYNFTNAARDKNSENVVIISNPDLTSEYRQNWIKLAHEK